MLPSSIPDQSARILFVDDDPLVLSGIRRQLSLVQAEWTVEFAEGGQEALARMAANPADVVVTDIAMPGMDGKELIQRITEKYPFTVPVILSGHWRHLTAFTSFGAGLRFLAKPVTAEFLIWTVRQALIEAKLAKSGPVLDEGIQPVECGQPQIDAGRQEIETLIEFIDTLFVEKSQKEKIILSLNEYYKLLNKLCPLEDSLMAKIADNKNSGHVLIHKKHHMDNLQFILDAINNLSNSDDAEDALNTTHYMLKKMTRDMRVDDMELNIILIMESMSI